MIDIHTHIIHNCDDGSNSLELSIKQITNMIDKGVTDIVLTPHYMNSYVQTDAKIINKQFKELSEATADLKVNLHKGGEIFLNPGSNYKIDKELCIGDTSYILVETNMGEFTPGIYEILFKLVKKGLRPILAHPERYNYIMNNPEMAEDFMYRNVYLQVNAGSILGLYGSKIEKTVWQLIKSGFVHFLASDNHCRIDEYILPAAIEAIRDKIDDYTADLLTQVNPQKMLNNEKIEYFYLKEQKVEKKGFFENILRKL
ncbi:MAG: CpsB/CapC family capsule biosynthesis tyrosine phosphatase [Candidatus Tenebribacter burtonii]|jgi:protein-tyrosine phosphatase|nr:CpsB/CapC family capsule biosynthesis tyrosine phosphatase [Candidatus Tenebribacter burtonii]